MDQVPNVSEVEQVRNALSKHIRADERALWIGKPEKTPFIVPTLAAIPFGLIFFGFSIFWMWGAGFAGAPWPFVLFGLPFVLIGLGTTVGGPILGLMRYRNTEYMITDQRIITQTGAIGLDTRFVDFDKIQEVYVKVGFIDKMFGTGSVLAITAGHVYVGEGGPYMRPSLVALKDPYKVQKLLQEAIEKARMTWTKR
jgi:uncharacterized membrane protein YdbT with pleckstrin-like domain